MVTTFFGPGYVLKQILILRDLLNLIFLMKVKVRFFGCVGGEGEYNHNTIVKVINYHPLEI